MNAVFGCAEVEGGGAPQKRYTNRAAQSEPGLASGLRGHQQAYAKDSRRGRMTDSDVGNGKMFAVNESDNSILFIIA